MPEELEEKKKQAFESEKKAVAGAGVVLVGTYKEKQLDWIRNNGVYNYPVKDGSGLTDEACRKIRELWLYADAKATRHCFAAEFVGMQSRDEFLAANPTYAKLGKGRHARYMVFKTSPLVYGPALEGAKVFARASDFSGGRSKKVAEAIKAFQNGGDFASLADYLPSELADLPHEQLCICEGAVQLDFLDFFDVNRTFEIIGAPTALQATESLDGRLTCLDFFAGSGLVSEGLSLDFRTVWANDISAKKALVFNANNRDGVLQVCPIQNITGKVLPPVDMSWGSFPCQDLSLAGDIKGLYASRSGLFWQWLRVMDEMPQKPSVVVAENVVGLVSAAGGRYYVAVHDELTKRGYRVGAVMLDAASWLPQSRKRIFVVGIGGSADISSLVTDGPSWCHPDPIVKVSSLVRDWVWWRMPPPEAVHTRIDDIVDFDCPCDSDDMRQGKLSLISPEKLDEIRAISKAERRAFTGYRRTRNHRQVLEVRTDGMAGCLRTPGGGSSRQILIIASNGQIRTRLLTVREAARLMGAPDTYVIPGSYNDGYMAMGDAVAVPVVRYLSSHLLAPLARLAREEGFGYVS